MHDNFGDINTFTSSWVAPVQQVGLPVYCSVYNSSWVFACPLKCQTASWCRRRCTVSASEPCKMRNIDRETPVWVKSSICLRTTHAVPSARVASMPLYSTVKITARSWLVPNTVAATVDLNNSSERSQQVRSEALRIGQPCKPTRVLCNFRIL